MLHPASSARLRSRGVAPPAAFMSANRTESLKVNGIACPRKKRRPYSVTWRGRAARSTEATLAAGRLATQLRGFPEMQQAIRRGVIGVTGRRTHYRVLQVTLAAQGRCVATTTLSTHKCWAVGPPEMPRLKVSCTALSRSTALWRKRRPDHVPRSTPSIQSR